MRKLLLTVLIFMLIVAGCGGKKEKSGGGRLRVVATVGMITDLVGVIAGEHAEVHGLMGAGVDPHLYKASHGDVEQLSNADLIFYDGLHLEGKMTDVLEKMARGKSVIAVSKGIPEELLREPPEFEGHYDPHVWMVPKLWAYTIPVIVEALSTERPQFKEYFETRAASVTTELEKLQAWAEAQMATIPEEQRVLVTAHDAFGYFGEHFNIEVRGLQGISTATDYGLADVTDLVALLTDRQIKGVFVESSVPTKPLEAVIEGCKSRGHNVTIGGTLYSDAMGATGTPEGTYIGMIMHNVETIVGALK